MDDEIWMKECRETPEKQASAGLVEHLEPEVLRPERVEGFGRIGQKTAFKILRRPVW